VGVETRRSGFSHLQSFGNFQVGGVAVWPLGHNGLWLLPYDTTRRSADFDTYVLYDQVIVSTQPIPCPTA